MMNIRINRKSGLLYILNMQSLWFKIFPKSELWVRKASPVNASEHVCTYQIHTHTHTPNLHKLLQRIGKERNTPCNTFCRARKKLRPKPDKETTKWENHRKLCFSVFCFPKQNIHKRDSLLYKMSNISWTCRYFFLRNAWVVSSSEINQYISNIKRRNFKNHHINRCKAFDKIHHQFIMKKTQE